MPPEAGYPPHMGARLKRAAYGLNDAPRLWWNRLDQSLRSYGLRPTRADRCCYVLYSDASTRKSYISSEATLAQPAPAIWEATLQSEVANTLKATLQSNSQERPLDIDGALELLLDPITGSQSKGKTVDGILTIYVDDAFFFGNAKFHKTVIDSLKTMMTRSTDDCGR